MFSINKEVLRFMVGQVDWTAVMHDMVDKQPLLVSQILNDHFSKDDDNINTKIPEASLEEILATAFTFAVKAWKTRSSSGHMTTGDKIKAIKTLREGFCIGLGEAKQVVEMMMEKYDQDAWYYPTYVPGQTGIKMFN